MTDLRTIEEWGADTKYQSKRFGFYWDGECLEAYFPERECLTRPGKMIDAALRLSHNPEWPTFKRPIGRKTAEQIIMTAAIVDALHEVTESIKIDGELLVTPHPRDETKVWAVLESIAEQAARRLLAEHPRA